MSVTCTEWTVCTESHDQVWGSVLRPLQTGFWSGWAGLLHCRRGSEVEKISRHQIEQLVRFTSLADM